MAGTGHDRDGELRRIAAASGFRLERVVDDAVDDPLFDLIDQATNTTVVARAGLDSIAAFLENPQDG